MRKKYILKIFIIFASLFSVFECYSEPFKVVSATIHQFQTPVLVRNEFNQLFHLKIETTGNENPLALNELNLELTGSDIINDIKKLEVFYTKNNPFLIDGLRFGTDEKPGNQITFTGKQVLQTGTNIFVVSVILNEKANILNNARATCRSLKINDKTLIPEVPNPIQFKRFGIALRKHNDDGVHTYRIPGLETTNKGTLIAVYDVRRNSSTDLQEDIDVGMNRSTDGGRTWEPMRIIMDMGEWGGLPDIENGIGDPSILVDRQTGTIWVGAIWAHGHKNQRNWFASKPGVKPEETSQFMLVKSEDDGLTWSEPINITAEIKNPKWHLFLQGPGKGITMQNGTLVFPAQFKDENQVPHSTIIYSTDHGKTWKSGTGAKSETTEAQVIELNNGSLMLNMRDDRNRSNKSETNGRSVMVSGDMGKTWNEHPTSNGALIEPNCMASLIKEEFSVDGKLQKLVLFSNPNSKYNRENITVKTSFDDGNTWPSEYNLLIDELRGNGYSCLTKTDDNHLGILYEGSQADLVFQIIPIEEIIQQHNDFSTIFKSGTEGYSTFRIPAIITSNSGRLLAFAEGRVNSSSDTGNIDLVMRSSDDKGKTWSPLKVIWNDEENVCGNPAPVVDTETGNIFLLMTWNLGEDHERDIIDGKSKDTRRIFVSSSNDDGENWTAPKEITSSVKKENWTWYATGPGHGIQLKHGEKKGRMVIPCDHIEAGSKKYFSHIIFSDDQGKTWQLGGRTRQDQVNECTVAELPDGKLLLNMRNYDRSQKSRKISYSEDAGASWSSIIPDTALIEPICQASLLFTDDDNTLWFLNPASKNSRVNMTLKSSMDFGETWQTQKVLNSGPSAYSDLTLMDKTTIGCLYEGGRLSPYEGINFTTYKIK